MNLEELGEGQTILKRISAVLLDHCFSGKAGMHKTEKERHYSQQEHTSLLCYRYFTEVEGEILFKYQSRGKG